MRETAGVNTSTIAYEDSVLTQLNLTVYIYMSLAVQTAISTLWPSTHYAALSIGIPTDHTQCTVVIYIRATISC